MKILSAGEVPVGEVARNGRALQRKGMGMGVRLSMLVQHLALVTVRGLNALTLPAAVVTRQN